MHTVYSSGSTPSDIMLIGQSPGRMEAAIGYPFVGPSGDILSMVLKHCGANGPYFKASIYMTNLVKEFREGNPPPTNEQILYWSQTLRDEVEVCNPKVIITCGTWASWWFLGGWGKWGMRTIHGRPCRGGELFDSTDKSIVSYPEIIAEYPKFPAEIPTLQRLLDLKNDYNSRACGAIVIPCFHPANALPDRDPEGTMMGMVCKDFDTALRTYETILAGGTIDIPADNGKEFYNDVSGIELATYIENTAHTGVLAIDTEDNNDGSPWSIQVCAKPGVAVTLRTERTDLYRGIDAVQQAIDNGVLILLHFAFHDLPVLRALGLHCEHINLVDTGVMLYLLGEPQGLKIAQWRWCGMVSDAYLDIVGDIGRVKQIKYLIAVELADYPKLAKQPIMLNNGTSILYGPQSPSTKAKKITKAITAGETDIDIYKRWNNIASGKSSGHKRLLNEIFQGVINDMGPMPRGCLADVYDSGDESKAIRYASRDADATLRVYLSTLVRLQEMGLA